MSFATSLWHGDMNSVLKKHFSFVISYSQPGLKCVQVPQLEHAAPLAATLSLLSRMWSCLSRF